MPSPAPSRAVSPISRGSTEHRHTPSHSPCGRVRTLGYFYVKHADKGEYYDPDENKCRACGQKGDRGACYVVHPEEAALVQRIFRLCVEYGYSGYAIAELLSREGVPTSMAQRRTVPGLGWHTSTISSILHNTAYIGTLYDGKTQRLPGKSNPDKKTRSRRVPRDEWIPIAVPPIIDPATFEAAHVQLQRNKRLARRNRKQEYLLGSGRLRCGQCGGGMTGGAKRGVRYYVCNRRVYQDAVAPHTKRSVQAQEIEPQVWEVVERALNNPALIAAELARRREGTSTQQAALDRERQQYQRQLAQCDKDLKRWEAAYLGEAIDLADFKAKKAEVDARRLSAEQELARLEAEQRFIEQTELETTALMDYCTRVRQHLQHFTLEEKQRALEALNITVIWHPDWPEPRIEGSIPVLIVSNAA
jgi:site-specific DNA recombinase